MPFSAFFPAGVADTTLIARLTRYSELQGVLRMVVGGLQAVMRRGSFSLPPSVINATERFKREADPLRGFIDERIEFVDGVFIPRTDVYNAYVAWSAVNGFHSMSASRFYESFASAAADTQKKPLRIVFRNGTRGIVGLRIN